MNPATDQQMLGWHNSFLGERPKFNAALLVWGGREGYHYLHISLASATRDRNLGCQHHWGTAHERQHRQLEECQSAGVL